MFFLRLARNGYAALVKLLAQCRLYTFVDAAFLRGRSPEFIAQQLCDGGADLIQLRAKDCTRKQILGMAEAILPVTRRSGVGLVINDHPDISREVGAEFCHLGQEDFFDASGPDFASQILTSQLGLSTHSPDQAERALAANPAYIAIGPVYATGTKPGAKPVTLDYVRWASTHVSIPWFAIGGIKLSNLDEVLNAGARRICIVSGILDAPDIAKACREFRERIG